MDQARKAASVAGQHDSVRTRGAINNSCARVHAESVCQSAGWRGSALRGPPCVEMSTLGRESTVAGFAGDSRQKRRMETLRTSLLPAAGEKKIVFSRGPSRSYFAGARGVCFVCPEPGACL